MAVNKVVYGNSTLIDITDTGITDDSQVANGVVYYRADGSRHVGTNSGGGGVDPFFNVNGDLSLATMQITNLSESFADAVSAIGAGKTVKLSLNYINPVGANETAIAINGITRQDLIRFYPLMVANFGAGNAPYLFDVTWTSSGMTLTPYPLAVQS